MWRRRALTLPLFVLVRTLAAHPSNVTVRLFNSFSKGLYGTKVGDVDIFFADVTMTSERAHCGADPLGIEAPPCESKAALEEIETKHVCCVLFGTPYFISEMGLLVQVQEAGGGFASLFSVPVLNIFCICLFIILVCGHLIWVVEVSLLLQSAVLHVPKERGEAGGERTGGGRGKRERKVYTYLSCVCLLILIPIYHAHLATPPLTLRLRCTACAASYCLHCFSANIHFTSPHQAQWQFETVPTGLQQRNRARLLVGDRNGVSI